ncbi:MAG: prepilin-type N-terminal cleavage/methylation domain-containing protein [Phycisphaerae bacterium]|nr:prepilin-type N-terminal cleavage/methylation domain-containing protein [Phycisphaerae bacterium]
MHVHAIPRRRKPYGFTLIELLVVVAIIALLISILLPSLSKAREQARTSLCLSRISQLNKAMLLYADDFDESPPFLAQGHRNMDEIANKYHGNPKDSHDELWYWYQETWCVPNLPDICYVPDWTALDPTPTSRDGSLFSYTRFENLYRCPEFERIAVGQTGYLGEPKTQNVFNYTRSVLGRKLLSNVLDDDGADDELCPGPTLKVSQAYAPAGLFMIIDEQWDFHCAGNYDGDGAIPFRGFPMAAETVNTLIADAIGSYHGVSGKIVDYDFIIPSKSGSIAYYDGHAALYQDPWPWRNVMPGSASIDLLTTLVNDFMAVPQGPAAKALDPLLLSIYAQRGIGLTPNLVAALLGLM